MNKKDKRFDFTAIVYPFYKKSAIQVELYRIEDFVRYIDTHQPKGKVDVKEYGNGNTIEDYIEYINEYKLEQASISLTDFTLLRYCPTLKYLEIFPGGSGGLTSKVIDFSPLYSLPEIKHLNCGNVYGIHYQYGAKIDFAKVKGLTSLCFTAHKDAINYNELTELKSLKVDKWKKNDLVDLNGSKQLDTLVLLQCGMISLKGIESSEKMQCLYLWYNRKLKDISALSKVKNTLRLLSIENCSGIEDFSVLGELENLECLRLFGGNKIPNLNFLKNLKNLKTFIFDVEILDGDLSPCLELEHARCVKGKRYYNLKDKDLPKADKMVRGNEDIEEWRRLE